MGVWRGLVWAFARNTEAGKKLLGQETLQEQGAREREELKARLQGRWHSKYTERQGTVELLIDQNGNSTTSYPHVHVIHDEVKYEVRILVSLAPRNHPHHETLPGSASGNEVNAAIDRALVALRRY